tara:strand:- start:1230 stop:1574 length:345 start_codon:yes stop_codon:yes gene_type:complete
MSEVTAVQRTERIALMAILSRLFHRIRQEFRNVQPWNDDQTWKYPDLEAMPLPGSWGVVVMHPLISNSKYQYATDNPALSIMHLKAPGPARVFLHGWDETTGKPCVVSEPIFPE